MSAIDPNKKAVVEELLRRQGELPPEKVAVVRELASRMGIAESQGGVRMRVPRSQFGDVQSGESTTAGPHQPTRYTNPLFGGVPTPEGVLGFVKGLPKAAGETVQAGGQWIEHILGMPVSPPRTTPVPSMSTPIDQRVPGGRDVFQPSNTAEDAGKTAGQMAMALAGGLAAGPTIPAQIASGGIVGALQNPDNPGVSAGLGMAAPVAVAGIQKAIPLAQALISGKAPAIAKFDTVMAAAKDVPLQLGEVDDIALRARELAGQGVKTPGRGSTLPKVFSDYIKHREQNIPMTYEIGRDFAKTAGRISASEKMAATGEMEAVLAKFSNALKTANRDAAAKVGMGEMYDAAMKEYRLAATVADKADIIKKWARNAAIAGALGGSGVAGAGLYKKLTQ